MLMIDALRQSVKERTDKPAVIYRDQVTTYRELMEQVEDRAAALVAAGVAKGDRVGLLMFNSLDFVTSYFAVIAAGGVVVPLNTMFKAEELKFILGDSGAKLLLTMPDFGKTVSSIIRDLPALQVIMTAPGDENFPVFTGIPRRRPFIPPANIMETEIAVFLYTSGTTGKPKGAMLSHANLVWNANTTREFLRLTADDVYMCVLPLFHTLAATVCMLMPLFSGGTTVILETFVPHNVMKGIGDYRVSIFTGVPAMYTVLANMADTAAYDIRSLRTCLCGGAPMPVEVIKRFEAKFDAIITEGYGLSETSPVCSVNPIDGVRKPGTIGIPIPGVTMKVFDDADREVPPGTVGEIVVRGPNVMAGYYNQPEATREALKNGWFHTGDLGVMDRDGYFSIVDRKKDMIIVGGLNVYPREIEEVLYSHPKVAEAAVIGTGDPLRGETVRAYIALREGEQATARELISFCRERLANYKVPKEIVFRDKLPRTQSGKVLKYVLREEDKRREQGIVV